MEETIFQRMGSLLDYLGEVIKLGRMVIRDVKHHDDLLLYQGDIPETEGISLFSKNEEELSWLTIYQQIVSLQPLIPDIINNWVNVYEDPFKEPEVVETRSIPSETDDSEETRTVNFYDDEKRVVAFDEYKKEWEEWSRDAKIKKRVQKLYREFFHVKERIKYDEQLEFIWGHGLLMWETNGHVIEYPIITRTMLIKHNVEEGIIHVLPPDDAEPKLEFDSLTDIQIPDLSNLKKIFQDSDYDPSDTESYSSLLKSIVRTISPDGQYLESKDDLKDANPKIPKIIDCWVIFVRKRLEDAIKKDIDNFKTKLKNRTDDSLSFPNGLKPLFEDPKAEPPVYDSSEQRDEWSAFLDKEILFPLPANNEQIQILDRIENANGIVVQGPPGTGKSHTIVNLICHFMAQGKRVLVTSQKDQALSVLHGMIPDRIKPLCLSVLTYDADTRKKLEAAVGMITEIVSNNQPSELKKEIKEQSDRVDDRKEKISKIENKIKDLTGAQFRKVYLKENGVATTLMPSELALKLKGESKDHEWLKDIPPYETKRISVEGMDAVSILINPPSEKEINALIKFRKQLLPYFDDFNYDFPATNNLINGSKLEKIFKDLRKRYYLQTQIEDLIKGLIFKDEDEKRIEMAIRILKEGIISLRKIREPWQKSLLRKIRSSDSEIESIRLAKDRLLYRAREIEKLWKAQDPLKRIVAGDLNDLESLWVYVTDAEARCKKGKKTFTIFDKKEKKDALKAIRINDKEPSTEKDWYIVKRYLELLRKSNNIRTQWNSFAQRIKAPILPFIASSNEVKKLLGTLEKLYVPFKYQELIFPNAFKTLSEIIVRPEEFIKEGHMVNLYKALVIKKEQKAFRSSLEALNFQKDYLSHFKGEGNPHFQGSDMLQLLHDFSAENPINEDGEIINRWNQAYQYIQNLNSLKKNWDDFTTIIESLKISAPNWANRWLDKQENNNLCPPYWLKTWMHNALTGYLNDISNEAEKVENLKKEQEKFERLLRLDKEKLAFAKTKLGLILNTTQACMQSLKGWLLAVKKLGKGTGKWAWKKQKIVQQEMVQAQNAVPVWIMPFYRVSQTIPSEFCNFDIAIIDEASQSNEFAFLALMRAKKVIVVGDPEQISPISVGIPPAEIDKIKNEHLKDIPGYHRYGLDTSLYALADVAFGSQNTLMLREHFRCVPEIIKFSNNLCYHGKIWPLRNPPYEQRLNPPCQPIFVEEGYREGRQNINKPEAKRICEKIKELANNNSYKDKTFGVISLVGKDQAKYIHTLIDDYLTPEDRERHQFHVGDAYAFQGDERDVMFLSMVVSGNDNIKLTAFVTDVYKQRFNVAASRAKDQMFLFHSVRMGIDLKNPQDLKYQLLNFFQSGLPPSGEKEKPIDLFESPFEEAVYNWLVSRGYYVTPQVKVGEFRIDLVVEGKDNRLAVECDGDRYHPPDQWWHDRLRQRQIERAGWKFWRVWGSVFYFDPDSAMAPIIPVLDELGIQPTNFQKSQKEKSHDKNDTIDNREVYQKKEVDKIQSVKETEKPKEETPFVYKSGPAVKESIIEDQQKKSKTDKVKVIQESKLKRAKISQIDASSYIDPLPNALSHILSEKEQKCRECGGKTQILIGWNGPFLKCLYFKCKKTASIDKHLLDDVFQILQIPCTKCGKPMKVAWGAKGPFPGCSDYPDCKTSEPWKDLRERLKQKDVRQKLGATK